MKTTSFLALTFLAACARDPSAVPSGTYHCQTLKEDSSYRKSELGAIVMGAGSYSAPPRPGSGTYAAAGGVVSFTGGPFDGWRAALGKTSAGTYLRFRGSSTGAPGDQTRAGDHLCFVSP